LVAALGNVLILAREEVVAALLSLMVELRGFQPTFLKGEKSVEDAVPILFSPSRMQAEAREVAARHGIRSFRLPTDPDTFGRMLEA
jgi:hypothetical protein